MEELQYLSGGEHDMALAADSLGYAPKLLFIARIALLDLAQR
jgi:hypothetical protein